MKYIMLISLILISCTNKNKGGPYKVKIPVEDSKGNYSLQVVEIPTLQNPDAVESNLIKVRLNTQIKSGNVNTEEVPHARYILVDGNTIIPKDTVTAQLFGLYKTMEDLYFIDKSSGISSHLTYPRTISLQTNDLSNVNKNESIYLKNTDRILVSASTTEGVMPIAFNKSVIARDHFLAIFNVMTLAEQKILGTNKAIKTLFREKNNTLRIYTKKLNENQKWNYMLFDVIEEALADYWSHLVTGKEKPFPESLVHTQVRVLNGEVGVLGDQISLEKSLNFDEFFSDDLESQKLVAENILTTSSLFSNLIKKLTETEGLLTVQDRASWIAGGLANVSVLLDDSLKNKISPTQFLNVFLKTSHKSKLTSETCDNLKLFLQSYESVDLCL